MSYANKSHAHRDEKNDYSRIEEKFLIEKELDLIIPHSDTLDYEEDDEEEDFCKAAANIAIDEYKRGVEAARI